MERDGKSVPGGVKENCMNIYEKISDIMKNVQYLAKDDRVEFGNTKYKALSEEKVTSIMRKELLSHGLIVYPISQAANRQGSITHVDVVYRMVNAENPDEYIEIASCGDGADTQDKGSGKAMTYAFKYMWLRTFALPTGEDPDKISSEELDDKERMEAQKPGNRIPPDGDEPVFCEECHSRFADYWDGHRLIKAAEMGNRQKEKFGRILCAKCGRKQ